MQLPRAMTEPDEYGVRGGVEYSFMSTSRDREVAMRYAQTKQEHAKTTKGMVYEVKMGMA